MSIKRFIKPAFFVLISLLIHILLIGVLTIDPMGLINFFYDKKYPPKKRQPPIIVNVIDLKKPDFKAPTPVLPKENSLASTHTQVVDKETSPSSLNSEEVVQRLQSKKKQPQKPGEDKAEEVESSKTKPNLMPTTKDITKVLREESIKQLAKSPSKRSVKNKSRSTKLSLNTIDTRYAEYMLSFKRRVELFWSYPTASVARAEQGRLKIDFTIDKDGTIKNIKLIKSSNYPALDDAAITALRLASPFQALPKNFDLNKIDINANFEYNLIYR